MYATRQEGDAVSEQLENSRLRLGGGLDRDRLWQQGRHLVGRDEADPPVALGQPTGAEPHDVT